MAHDPASVLLADQIAGQIRDSRLKPGALVASEQELRSNHETGRSVVRQAVRILEERGVAFMRRGNGGGLIVAPPKPEFAGRALSIAIESRLQGALGLQSLMKAADTHMFLAGAAKVDVASCEQIRRLTQKLGGLPEDEFRRVRGSHQLLKALWSLFKDPLVALAYETTSEYGFDFLPYGVILAEEGTRGHFWEMALEQIEALIAADVPAMFEHRRRQNDVLASRFGDLGEIERGRTAPAIDQAGDEQPMHSRAERLAREILRDVRQMDWKAGERIGGAVELMERYGVTIGTLRQAVRMLEEHSAVRMERGRNGGLFIDQPDLSAAAERALEYLAQTAVEPADARAFLIQVVLEAISLMSARPAAMGELRAAIQAVRQAPGGEADAGLYREIARLSGNTALKVFGDILAAQVPFGVAGGSSPLLGVLAAAAEAGDAAKARRAFMQYARSGDLFRPL